MDELMKHEAELPASGPRCPFCGSHETDLLSLFGSQLLTEQYYCTACHTPFERVRDDAQGFAAGPKCDIISPEPP
jgi:hypothetical protein